MLSLAARSMISVWETLDPTERRQVMLEMDIRERGVGMYATMRDPMLDLLNYLIAHDYKKIPYAQWLEIVELWRPIYAQIASMYIHWDESNRMIIEATSIPGKFIEISRGTDDNGMDILNVHNFASLRECIENLHGRKQPDCFILNGEDILPRFREYTNKT